MAGYSTLHEPLLPILHRLLADAALLRTGCVLDLACGDAAKWPLYQAAFGPNVQLVGVDWDREAIALPMATSAATDPQHNAQPRVVVGDAHQLPFAAATFDAALCIAALGLFADAQRVLTELRRVLRPNAPAVIFTAERRWAQVMRWPAALAMQLGALTAQTALPSASADLTGDLEQVLHLSGFPRVTGRAFLLEEHLPPAIAELALLPWAAVRPVLAANLSAADLVACDSIEPEIELCSVALAGVAYRDLL
jgi:ubiquinone/menaquinone biosynthesis C-methylase UbiE